VEVLFLGLSLVVHAPRATDWIVWIFRRWKLVGCGLLFRSVCYCVQASLDTAPLLSPLLERWVAPSTLKALSRRFVCARAFGFDAHGGG
jgi:hypothetical protein